jgi:diguanylate cyclase (GGDEF)-like protein
MGMVAHTAVWFPYLINDWADLVKILPDLEKPGKSFLILAAYELIIIIGFIDYVTGSELAFSAFYVIPICLITWVTNQRFGLVASNVSALVWFFADITTADPYSSQLVPIWNTLIRLTFFVIITLLLSSLKNSLRLAHTDYLTSAVNLRYFHEIAQMEINRCERYQHPFSIAYIDLDNFKTMNDQFGHFSGDEVLRTLVATARSVIRRTDFIARLGGDEFAILFPETDQESAHFIFSKIQDLFTEEMQKKGWPITFSVGILTCRTSPHTADELIKMADNLMYAAKADGKNTVKYATYPG